MQLTTYKSEVFISLYVGRNPEHLFNRHITELKTESSIYITDVDSRVDLIVIWTTMPLINWWSREVNCAVLSQLNHTTGSSKDFHLHLFCSGSAATLSINNSWQRSIRKEGLLWVRRGRGHGFQQQGTVFSMAESLVCIKMWTGCTEDVVEDRRHTKTQ